MFKTKLLLALLCISIATVVQAQESTPSSASPPSTAINSQYGDRGTVEWSGAITGYYSAANTYTTSPAGETRLIQISVAPVLNLFIAGRFYLGAGPNILYANSKVSAPNATTIAIEQAFIGPQVQFGRIWPLTEMLYLNTRAIAMAQLPIASSYTGVTGKDLKVGSVGGEVLLQFRYDRVLLNAGVQFLYSQYLSNISQGLQQSAYTTRVTFGFSFWVG